jgi:hypothetical protein
MSLFRPTRTVTDPRGREWEIYVSRYQAPAWEPSDDGSVDGLDPYGRGAAAGALLELPLFLWHQLLMPLLRFVALLPYRFVRGRRSRTVWIEAIAWGIYPHKETIRWTTTPDHAGRVLDQIARGLAEGDLPRPLGGVFLSRSST